VRHDDRVLIDFRTSDDAGVYRWDEKTALVQTVDFFTPIVDDPFVYGQIAAANALSDIYAMGATPLTALAVAAFPQQAVDSSVISEVFKGGFAKLREANVALLGGHTVQDREMKFGYAVTGVVDPARVLSNAGARPGDVVMLTKPIGTGVIATAIKYDRAPQRAVDAAIETMLALNRAAAEILQELPRGSVHACTDVTGFGLIGHAEEVAEASHVTIHVVAGAVPLIDGALDLARRNRSGGLGTNEAYFRAGVRVAAMVDPDRLALLYDPQTSGGLLVTVDPAVEPELGARCRGAGVALARIGHVAERADHAVFVA
jgi:selenide, water dikinase